MSRFRHNPYRCDADCCITHNDEHCSRCGCFIDADDFGVIYVLGRDLAADRKVSWPYSTPDRWVTLCGPCDDAVYS